MPRRKKKKPTPSLLGWAFWALFLIVTLLVTLWILKPLKAPEKIYRKPPTKIGKPLKKAQKAALSKPSPSEKRPVACIIIDDMGQNPALERKFFRLGLVLNFSFLPEAPFTKRLATEAHARGFEVLVHLPLEAQKGRDRSTWITLRMGEVEVKRRVREAVRRVPYAIGVNHHMGSAFSADKKHMQWVLEEVQRLGLFYIDSRTTAQTVVPEVAREIGLPFAERNIFLDHHQEYAAVCRALEAFLRRARGGESVLAIAHPHPQTLKAFEKFRKRLRSDIKLVPASVFVKIYKERKLAHDQRTSP